MRTTLIFLLACFVSVAANANPHLDRSLVTGGCNSCHEGHGESGSPMLPVTQSEVCLTCHGSKASADEQVRLGILDQSAIPQLLEETLESAYTHPLTEGAFSRWEPDAVTCTSCHTPHRGASEPGRRGELTSRRKLSPRNPTEFEFQLCQSCHGSAGVETQDLRDISRQLSATNRSYHPLEAPAEASSPSTRDSAAGREINCTDCHGNSREGGPAGPHGSEIPYLLVSEYDTSDGADESRERFALCYSCHRRPEVLDSALFPLHRLHVVDERASCATCHSAHGSVRNRALIRFGEETIIGGVAESGQAGKLEFLSDSPGAGTCYLTCHGVDHAPETYGGGAADVGSAEERLLESFDAGPPSELYERGRRRRPAEKPDIKKP